MIRKGRLADGVSKCVDKRLLQETGKSLVVWGVGCVGDKDGKAG